jgi:hypothetical protein
MSIFHFLVKTGTQQCKVSRGTFSDSSILEKSEFTCTKQMFDWFGNTWQLCYRASTHGWYAKDFHSKCDNKGPTIVLVKVNEFIFGGFTDTNWGGKWHLTFPCGVGEVLSVSCQLSELAKLSFAVPENINIIFNGYFGLDNSSYRAQPHSIIVKYQKINKNLHHVSLYLGYDTWIRRWICHCRLDHLYLVV